MRLFEHPHWKAETKMAPVEWESILAAKPSSLNEEDADSFFDMLKEVSLWLVCTTCIAVSDSYGHVTQGPQNI